jgi:benzoate/toluate 1,2-dioxygenase subunit beta
MTTTSIPAQAGAPAEERGALITQNAIEQFLYREARYLDDREFEKWLA